MRASREFELAILGGGPAGLVCALAAAKSARTALIVRRLPPTDNHVRIDSIPARTLALMVELGVDPHRLGAEKLHEGRWVSWETTVPQWLPGAHTAHIERPLLEQALFEAVRNAARVTVFTGNMQPISASGSVGSGWRAPNFIDATGRSSVTARRWIRPAHPWASRFYWTTRAQTASPEFRIAALRCGYAYRLGSANRIGIGIAGRGRWLSANASEIERILREEGAGWLFQGMPALTSMVRGAAGTSSTQWSRRSRAALVGDAALARDSLSSQGLANSISDSLYAVAAFERGKPGLLADRHAANLGAHLNHMTDLLKRCRFRAAPLWFSYAAFITENRVRQTNGPHPVLRDTIRTIL